MSSAAARLGLWGLLLVDVKLPGPVVGEPMQVQRGAVRQVRPGQAQGKYQLFWEGRRARAVYVEKLHGFGWQGKLDVLSKPLEAELAAQQQARLKAENAQ